MTSKSLSTTDQEHLASCKSVLENPALIIKIADLVGKPIDLLIRLPPQKVQRKIAAITKNSLWGCLKIAVKTMNNKGTLPPCEYIQVKGKALNKLLVALSGAVGGALGLPALVLELPVSTTIMMRSIADIARQLGHDLRQPETQLQCLQVFALGGSSTADDAAENTYFTTRLALAKMLSEAAEYLAGRGAADHAAPVLVRFITAIASRFEVEVSEKFMAQAVPVIGAASGATINVLFTQHFQKMAEAHFTVLKLEKKYGKKLVRETYERL